MLVLLIGWGAFFLYTLVRFRASKHPKADYTGVKSHFSTYSEVGVAVFEGFLLVGLAIPVWSNVVTNRPDEKDAVVINVIAEQFSWNIHYSGKDGIFGRRDVSLVSADNPIGLDRSDPAGKDDIATINQLHLPVGEPVIIHLTTKDVIHSFGIPLLRVKQDAIPGQSIPVTFTATMTNDQLKAASVRTYHLTEGKMPLGISVMSARDEYLDKDGNVILTQDDFMTEEAVKALISAGITELRAGSDTPMEIACAQLCGLGHYRMRGAVVIESMDDYQAWLEEEASYLDY
jgi:cytochrome c oxidase subunit 2